MNTWIRRSTCLGVLTAGLVASAATGASAATDPSAGPDPISAVLDVTADVSPAVVGQGGNGGQGGDGNKVAGADNAVGNGGRGGTTDASTLAKVPETLGMPGISSALSGTDGSVTVQLPGHVPGQTPDGGNGGTGNSVLGNGNTIANGGNVAPAERRKS